MKTLQQAIDQYKAHIESLKASGSEVLVHCYRFPTNIAWENGGFKVFYAANFETAIGEATARWPLCMQHTRPKEQFQILLWDQWTFTDNVPMDLGGSIGLEP